MEGLSRQRDPRQVRRARLRAVRPRPVRRVARVVRPRPRGGRRRPRARAVPAHGRSRRAGRSPSSTPAGTPSGSAASSSSAPSSRAGARGSYTAEHAREFEMQRELIRLGWGRDEHSFRLYFSSVFMPDADPELWTDFAELMRRTDVGRERAAPVRRVPRHGRHRVGPVAGPADADPPRPRRHADPLRAGGRRWPRSSGEPARAPRLAQPPAATRRAGLGAPPHRARGLPRRGRVHGGVHVACTSGPRPRRPSGATVAPSPDRGGAPWTTRARGPARTDARTTAGRRRRRRGALRRRGHRHAARGCRPRRARPRPGDRSRATPSRRTSSPAPRWSS